MLSPSQGIATRCARCGGEFRTWPSELKKGKGRFCSRSCKSAASTAAAVAPTRMSQRFWSHVEKDGPIVRDDLGPCWIWQAGRTKAGYGQFWTGRKLEYAHRVAWLLEHGRWPEPCALHHCDNPGCVRPEHLFEGTVTDNNDDRDAKGRTRPGRPLGEQHGNAKLTAQQVRHIRVAREKGITLGALARDLGVDQSTISDVARARTWRHVEGDK